MTAVGAGDLRATRPGRRRVLPTERTWRPRFTVLVVTSAVFTATGLWACGRGTSDGVVAWYASVVWTLPVVTAVPGVLGALLAARRTGARRPRAPTGTVQDLLVVVVPTIGRHDTQPALERVVASFHEHLPQRFARYRVDVVVEEGCEAADAIEALARPAVPVRVLTVPRAYRTPGGTLFKARANHFAHVLRQAEGEGRADVWVLHMDDDTALGGDTVTSLAAFIQAEAEAEAPTRTQPHGARHLAQGVLTFPREQAGSRLVWLADAIRPGCDISMFPACTGRGSPRCGLHGELLLVRASVEAGIGWDFGPHCLVEDAYFAMVFCERYPGGSAWFAGRSYGASPVGLSDFLRQRERWVWGLLELVTRSDVPWRRRLPLLRNVGVWVCGPLQHPALVLPVALLAGDAALTPVVALLVPVWAFNMGFCVWLYWEGLRLNALGSADPRARWSERVGLLVLIPLFTLWEVIGVARGLWRFLGQSDHAFHVIAKPR